MLASFLLRGFKSIEDQEPALGRINVLIGANGAGKSNLVSFFRLLEAVASNNLQVHVGRSGGASSLLHKGSKVTARIVGGLRLAGPGSHDLYEFSLAFGEGDRIFFESERLPVVPSDWQGRAGEGDRLAFEKEAVYAVPGSADFLGGGHLESNLRGVSSLDPAAARVLHFLEGLKVYHFDDTSAEAAIRGLGDAGAGRALRARGENLAAFLYRLREVRRPYYDRILATVRVVAPFFRDFVLAPSPFNTSKIQLRWRSVDSEYDFGPHQLSDGTLRFMALASLFLQPDDERPHFIVVDEPELGLHPLAMHVLAGLVHSAVAGSSQVLLCTQSASLLDEFAPEDVITVRLDGGRSVFERLDPAALAEWLEEYTLSELWQRNVIGGGPYR